MPDGEFIDIPNVEDGLSDYQRDTLLTKMAGGINHILRFEKKIENEIYGNKDYPGMKSKLDSTCISTEKNYSLIKWILGIIATSGIGVAGVVVTNGGGIP
jgi:hypothetical protein